MTHVLVTGANGNLGGKAVSALVGSGGITVTALDLAVRDPHDASRSVAGDLTEFGDWVDSFAGVDVVLHLAAAPRPTATWETVLRSNIDASHHVLLAAERHGVRRVVFASSNWVLGGYRFGDARLTPHTTPWPINPYGMSKLATERDGAAAVERGAFSFLALRIGWCQPGENRPGPHMSFGRWGQHLWLSNDDWRQAVQLSCTVPFEGFDVVNVMSDTAGSRWDLAHTERVLGYIPQSRHTPRLSTRGRLLDAAARGRDLLRPFTDSLGFGSRW